MASDVDAVLHRLPKGELRAAGKACHDRLLGAGATAYVKTVYIGYQIGRDMVAALHPHPDRVELALALAEQHDSSLLVNASHLTWRTLPVAAVIRGPTDADQVIGLIEEAVERVSSGVHDVHRDSGYFARVRKERWAAREGSNDDGGA